MLHTTTTASHLTTAATTTIAAAAVYTTLYPLHYILYPTPSHLTLQATFSGIHSSAAGFFLTCLSVDVHLTFPIYSPRALYSLTSPLRRTTSLSHFTSHPSVLLLNACEVFLVPSPFQLTASPVPSRLSLLPPSLPVPTTLLATCQTDGPLLSPT